MPYKESQNYLTILKLFCINIYLYFTAFMNYLNIQTEIFIILTGLIFIDFITEILAVQRLKKAVRPTHLKALVISKFVLLFIPLTFALTAKILDIKHYEFLVYAGIDIIALSELYSVIGNIYTIRTRNTLPDFDVVKILGDKIKQAIEKNLDITIKAKDEK